MEIRLTYYLGGSRFVSICVDRTLDAVWRPERPLAFQGKEKTQSNHHLLGSYFSPRDEGIPREDVAEWLVRSLGDTDARGRTNGLSAISIFADPQAAGGGGQIAAIVASAGNGESLRQPSRSTGKFKQVFRSVNFGSASLSHFFYARKRFERANQNRPGAAFRLARDVEAVVISVDEVNIGMAGRPE